MGPHITAEWIANLWRDVEAWDARGNQQRYQHWDRPYTPPRLTYAGPSTELEQGGRRRRASTGMTMGNSRHPPSEVLSWEGFDRVAMQMRLPKEVWAMLSQGREAESIDITLGVEWEQRQGIRGRERWREWDGERHNEWRDQEGRPRPRKWTEFHVQRMKWAKRDGVWRGEWTWEDYDRDKEWDDMWNRPREGKDWSLLASSAPWESVPQEVLLGMLRAIEVFTGYGATACRVCRAWFSICAPEMYREIYVGSPHITEFVDAISEPGSHIRQYANTLTIRGPIPLVLPKLLKLLPLLKSLDIQDSDETSRTAYNPGMLRLASTILIASGTALALTSLYFSQQWFSSTADVLCLLACFPRLTSTKFYYCTLQTASSTCPLVTSTRLWSVYLRRGTAAVHGDAIASLAQWWQWPHTAVDLTGPPFPGLCRADAQVVFATMRSIYFDGLEWDRVSLLLLESWHADSWVLFTKIEPNNHFECCMELELHVVRSPSSISGIPSDARVAHIVIRLNTLTPLVRDVPFGDMLERMDKSMTLLQHLRTVTLETPDAVGNERLAAKLARWQASGRLHVRTCKEAEQVAQAATQNPSGYSEEHGVVSPLWHLQKNERWTGYWLGLDGKYPPEYNPVSEEPTMGTGTTADAMTSLPVESDMLSVQEEVPCRTGEQSASPGSTSIHESSALNSSPRRIVEPLPTLSVSGYLFRV